jgi:hypothetical protein
MLFYSAPGRIGGCGLALTMLTRQVKSSDASVHLMCSRGAHDGTGLT